MKKTVIIFMPAVYFEVHISLSWNHIDLTIMRRINVYSILHVFDSHSLNPEVKQNFYTCSIARGKCEK